MSVALVIPIPSQTRPHPYADLARTLRDAGIGITPEVLRLNAAAQPDLADLYTGTAEAMELLEATP